jgi:CelD/BcsL family acetyltransferase involved in cellulose biosynthesis
MFDYLVNSYNQSPSLITESDLDQDYLYVKYTEAPYLVLPESLENLKSQHKRKFWYNLNRSQRLYEARFGVLHFEIIRDQENLDYFLDQVFDLFNKRWEGEYTSAAWKNKDGFKLYKEAMIDLASSGNAFLAVLYDENKKLLSYGYCLDQDKSLYFYQHTTTLEPMYRTFSLGKLLICSLLKFATAEGYEKFDFMAGTAPYKYEWAKQAQVIYKVIGSKNLISYCKYVITKVRYFLQFNFYTRRFLKFVWYQMEKRNGKI